MERIGLAPGSEVGGYRILAPLGSGGMGAVYRAADGGGAQVALKLLHPHVGADPDARERLRREVAALQRLRHPAVAAVLDAEADSSEAFLVTELVAGENLTDHVRVHGPLPVDELVELADGLHDALTAVHTAGVVHRDLKPSNVILTAEGPVLIDFGIAQGLDDARLTSTGIVLGTPGYLAPELLDGAEPTEDSDWWGWAAVLAFAATGREPFGSRPVEAVLARARAGEVDLDGAPAFVATALRGALTPTPAHRLSPVAVLDALEAGPGGLAHDGSVAGAGAGPGAAATTVLGAGPHAAGSPDPGPGSTTALADFSPGAAVGGPVGMAHGDAARAGANDGRTVALDRDDLPHSDFDDPGPDEDGAYVPPIPPKRRVALVALLLLAVAAAPLAPGVVLIVVAGAVILFGTVDSSARALESRRERRGVRRSDVFRAAVASPWHFVRGAALALPSLLVAASVVVVVGGIAWWALDTRRLWITSPTGGNDPWVYQTVIVVAVLAGLVTLWWGPLSAATRRGARRTLARLAPGRGGTLVLLALAAVGIALAVVLLLTGEPTFWWPLPGPPSLS